MHGPASPFLREPTFGHPARVCVDLPTHAERYRYAVQELLRRLRRDVVWVPKNELTRDDLYVGLAAPEVRCAAQLVLPSALDALSNPKWMPAEPILAGVRDVPLVLGTPDCPDWLGSAFFWLSGWQERAVPARDSHGRFPYSESLQARWNLPERPWVDLYAREVGHWGFGLSHDAPVHSPRFLPTFDLDQRHARTPGLLLRRLRAHGMASVLRTLWKDPVQNTLQRIHETLGALGGQGTCFVKAGATSRYDTPYPLAPALKRIAPMTVALHPSYVAALEATAFVQECERLRSLTGDSMLGVRSHYLRYDIQTTPRLHEKARCAWDSTLAWAEHPGFRRATAHPFRVYDLALDRETSVIEAPLLLMDGTLFVYQRASLLEANAITQVLLSEVQNVGGMATFLWHPWMWDDEMPLRGEHFLATLEHVSSLNLPLLDVPSALHAYGFR